MRLESYFEPRTNYGVTWNGMGLFRHPSMAVWRTGNGVGPVYQRSYSTSSPVSTGMDDPSSDGHTTSVCKQPPRPTQPGHPFVGRRNEYWRRFWPSL